MKKYMNWSEIHLSTDTMEGISHLENIEILDTVSQSHVLERRQKKNKKKKKNEHSGLSKETGEEDQEEETYLLELYLVSLV